MERTQRILDRLPLFYRAWDENSIVYNLIFALGKRLDEADKEVTAILRSHWVDTAFGHDLDRMGAVYGFERKQREGDTEYKNRLKQAVIEFKGGGTINWGIGRQIISRAGSLYARTILGVNVRDLTSGFACYRRQTLEQLDLDGVQSNGYSFQIEMKYRVLQAGMTIAELPIVFEDRRVGQSKMSRAIFIEAIGMVWKLRFSK